MTGRLRTRAPRLRTRVVAAATVSIVAAVVVLGAAVQVLLSRHLHQALDSTLRDRAAQVAQLAATAPALLTSPPVLEASVEARRLEVEVVDRNGRKLAGTTLAGRDLALRAIRSDRGVYGDGSLAGEHVRLYAAPLASLGGPASGGAVVVGSTTDEVDSTLHESRTLIVACAFAAALLVAPIAFVLTGRALRPLQTLAEGAEVIERRGDPSLRLPGSDDGRTPDEVARLADTLNRMLAALERSREGERRFVADASHELRNPLAALRGNAEYLARHGADAEALADLRSDADRLSRLVDELLVLAREDAAAVPDAEVRLDAIAIAAANGRVRAIAPDAVLVRGDDARTQPGSGLGLALVRATAERHGGRLEIDGPRFSIVLPALRRLSGDPGTNRADGPGGSGT